MIKILKHGNKMKIECQSCGSVLQYEYEDIQEKKFSKSWKRYIICPVCNEEIVTEATK